MFSVFKKIPSVLLHDKMKEKSERGWRCSTRDAAMFVIKDKYRKEQQGGSVEGTRRKIAC